MRQRDNYTGFSGEFYNRYDVDSRKTAASAGQTPAQSEQKYN
jgi:hypothetical protein